MSRELIHFKKLTARDLSALQQLGRSSYEPYYRYLWYEGGLDWYMHRCFNTELLTAELNDPNMEYAFIVDSSSTITGFLKLILQKPMPENFPANALFVEKIYFLPEFSGKGLGAAAMEQVAERSSQLNRDAIWLHCMDSGPVRFYEQLGFQIINTFRLDDFTLMREKYRGIHTMMKRLT